MLKLLLILHTLPINEIVFFEVILTKLKKASNLAASSFYPLVLSYSACLLNNRPPVEPNSKSLRTNELSLIVIQYCR